MHGHICGQVTRVRVVLKKYHATDLWKMADACINARATDNP